MLRVEWAGETFEPRPERALYWRRRGALIVADLHLGKSHHFRRAGVPVPHGTTRATLDRLAAAVDATGAGELIILGDLFHARGGVTDALLEALARWRRQHRACAVQLVTGNHDRHAGPPPADLDITCAGDELVLDEIVLRHDPADADADAAAAFTLAGHVHPAVALHARAGGGMRLPCFHFASRVGLLPAFGAFTGMHVIRPRAGDTVVAVGPDRLVSIPTAAQAGAKR